MKLRFLLCLAFLAVLFNQAGQAQTIEKAKADSILMERGEVYFSFSLEDPDDIHRLTRIISIDQVQGNSVKAYANRREFDEFLKLNTGFQVLTPPGLLLSREETDGNRQENRHGGRTIWNFYPTYEQYLGFMSGFVSAYPALCRLDTVGTSMQGRLILSLRISRNVAQEEAEPQFLYTSSIHGDETAGYVLMLHLIDHMLSNYGSDPEITNLVDNTEIVINPLANPDGTYHGGNNSVYGAVRYNANNIDLNRNFPDPKVGNHPDGNPWQTETMAWMDYATANHFIMSANFHGGSEVFNYPWDTWTKLHPDDDWWQFVGREWADTVHQHSPSSYFTGFNNGITNGNAWYEINGGRQDYMNYWHHCREVTLEISNIKLLPVSQLLNWWDYNYRSFLNYMRQSGFGVSGIVTDTVTDLPVAAKVYISGHDRDGSEVYSRAGTGFYTRPIQAGSYDITYSAPGYFSKTIAGVSVTAWNNTKVDVQLRPLTYDAQDKTTRSLMVYPNPSSGRFRLVLPESPVHPDCSLQVMSSTGSVIYTASLRLADDKRTTDLDLTFLSDGFYYLRFNTGYRIYLDKLILRK